MGAFWLRVPGACFCAASARRGFFLLRVRGALFFRGFDIFAARVPGRGPASRGAHFFAAGAQRFFFAAGARQVHSLTCCPPPPSIHCRKTSRVLGALFFGCGCASPLTHSLPAARSTHSKKAPTAKKNTVSLILPSKVRKKGLQGFTA